MPGSRGNKTSVPGSVEYLAGGRFFVSFVCFVCLVSRCAHSSHVPGPLLRPAAFESREKSAEKARKKLERALLTRGHCRHPVFVRGEACLSQRSTDTRLYPTRFHRDWPECLSPSLLSEPLPGVFKGCCSVSDSPRFRARPFQQAGYIPRIGFA